MANTDFKSVAEYLATQPPKTRAMLRKVRSIIRKAVPGAQEMISYQIPTYKLHGGAVIFFAGWKEHFSIYPLGERVTAVLKKDLSAYEVSKGTVRFSLTEPVPAKLIERIAKLRAKEIVERAKAKGR